MGRKSHITDRKKKIRGTADFSVERMPARRQWGNTFPWDTHAHMHTHTLIYTHSHTHTHTLTHSLTHTHINTHTHTLPASDAAPHEKTLSKTKVK